MTHFEPGDTVSDRIRTRKEKVIKQIKSFFCINIALLSILLEHEVVGPLFNPFMSCYIY